MALDDCVVCHKPTHKKFMVSCQDYGGHGYPCSTTDPCFLTIGPDCLKKVIKEKGLKELKLDPGYYALGGVFHGITLYASLDLSHGEKPIADEKKELKA